MKNYSNKKKYNLHRHQNIYEGEEMRKQRLENGKEKLAFIHLLIFFYFDTLILFSSFFPFSRSFLLETQRPTAPQME